MQVVLYKKLGRVSVNLVQVSCTELSRALFQDRNSPAHDLNRATWLTDQLLLILLSLVVDCFVDCFLWYIYVMLRLSGTMMNWCLNRLYSEKGIWVDPSEVSVALTMCSTILLVQETVMKNKNLCQISCRRRHAQVSGTSFLSVFDRQSSSLFHSWVLLIGDGSRQWDQLWDVHNNNYDDLCTEHVHATAACHCRLAGQYNSQWQCTGHWSQPSTGASCCTVHQQCTIITWAAADACAAV